MPSRPMPPSHPTCPPLLLALMLAAPLAATPTLAASQPVTDTRTRQYDIPGGPLGRTLAIFAAEAGVVLPIDGNVVADRSSTGLHGRYTIDAGFHQLLDEHGLVARLQDNGTWRLRRLPPRPTAAPAAPVASANAGDPDEPRELATVVVTGELLERENERTTSSVAVHKGADIERSTARDVYDVIRSTPNASLDDNDYGFSGMTLRGINGYGASGAGGFASYSTTSTVVLDGVGLPRSALGNVDLSAFDLEQVEVFRGPQSTSQGRNAMAGVVVVNTIAPEVESEFRPEFRGRLAGGDYGSWQGAAAFGATLWPDRLAVRISTDQRSDDGDIVNTTRSEDDWARRRSENTRVRANWTPAGPDGRYSALLSASDTSLYQGTRYVPMSQEYTRTSLSNAPQDYDNQSQLFSLEQRLRLTDHWDLRLISAYIESKTRSRFDLDYSADEKGTTVQEEDAKGSSQELRLGYTGERLRGSFGAYWFDGRDGDVSNAVINASYFGLNSAFGNVIANSGQPSKVRDSALFGELDWSATDRLTLTAGVRYDREENGRVIDTTIKGDNPLLDTIVSGLKSSGQLPQDGAETVSREFSAVLPKLAMSYELLDGWFLGAAYSEGYRPGGDGYNQVSGRRFSFDAERTRNVELSLKGQYQPWRLQTALNLFGTRWTDMQVQGGSGTDTYMSNAGEAEIRGGELELRWQPLQGLRVISSYGVTHGRFTDYMDTVNNQDLTGNRLPKAPKYSGTLALEWSPLHNLLLRPEMLWIGSTPANADNDPKHELDAYQLLNLSMRYQLGPVALFLNGSNLLDEHYRRDANDYSLSGAIDVVSLGDGRRLIGGLDFQF